MGLMERYIPTQEERLLSMLGFLSAEQVLEALGISTYRDESYRVVVVPRGTKPLDESVEPRLATDDEIKLHEKAVWDYHMEEAAAGLI